MPHSLTAAVLPPALEAEGAAAEEAAEEVAAAAEVASAAEVTGSGTVVAVGVATSVLLPAGTEDSIVAMPVDRGAVG